MRYHHGYGYGCHGYDDPHLGCGMGFDYGPRPGYGWGWDAPDEDPRPYRRRGRPGGTVARQTTAAQLEAYLASLRDEIRAAEQDLRDLGRTDDSGAGEGQT
jgi:hypothetical protein